MWDSGKFRELYLEKLFPLELVHKIHSYTSENQRNFGKILEFEKNELFCCWNVLYLFGPPIKPFLLFFALYGKKFYFCMRSWEKKSEKYKIFVVCCWILFFNFAFFLSIFFLSQLPWRTFGAPRYQSKFTPHFLPSIVENCIFSCQFYQFLLKIRRSLLKVWFFGFLRVATHFEINFQCEKLFRMVIAIASHYHSIF